MKLSIEHMTLRLPAEFRNRAGDIARLLGSELGRLRLTESLTVDALEVPPVRVRSDAGNGEVAKAIASAVAGRIGGAS
jgi:hypothetical protein